jgi:hypothetical protein
LRNNKPVAALFYPKPTEAMLVRNLLGQIDKLGALKDAVASAENKLRIADSELAARLREIRAEEERVLQEGMERRRNLRIKADGKIKERIEYLKIYGKPGDAGHLEAELKKIEEAEKSSVTAK